MQKNTIWVKIQVKESSNINSVFYDAENAVLRVIFKGNRMYEYNNVPASLITEWTRAESTGKFFNENIKWYDYKEIKNENVKYK